MTDDIALRARRRTRTVVAVAGAVLLGVAAAVTGLVMALSDGTAPTSQPAPPVAVAATGAPSAEAEPTSPASVSPAPPGALRWLTVAGARVPVSPTAGPADTSGGRARGFARTPLGAVLAAAHISVRLSAQAGPAVFEPTLREQVVGPDAAALGDDLEDSYQRARAQLGLPYGAPAGRLYSTIRGYRIATESADRPQVRLLIEGPGNSGGSVLVALTVDLQWVDDDWALVAPTGGDWSMATSLVTDATGYTEFPAGG
jgi:hypothetical protein